VKLKKDLRFYLLLILMISALICFVKFVTAQTKSPEVSPKAPAQNNENKDIKQPGYVIVFNGKVGDRQDFFVKPVTIDTSKTGVVTGPGGQKTSAVSAGAMFTVSGIMSFNGQKRAIIVYSGKSYNVKPGDVMFGTRILSIGSDSMTCVDSKGQNKPYNVGLTPQVQPVQKQGAESVPEGSIAPPAMQKPQVVTPEIPNMKPENAPDQNSMQVIPSKEGGN
jgi:hypothetical protein